MDIKATINLIVAIGRNRELGKENKLIWQISEDLQRFKALTTGHPIIMGRKTFESIGRPLPNRTNIIITRQTDFKAEGCLVTHSLSEALEIAKNIDHEIFIIGGGELYREALPLADKLYLTLIEAEAEADTFFPPYSEFSKIISQKDHETSEGLQYSFLELTRPN